MVLLNGFYEWHAKGGSSANKQPYYIGLADPQQQPLMMRMAGLYDVWHGELGGMCQATIACAPGHACRAHSGGSTFLPPSGFCNKTELCVPNPISLPE